MAVVTVRSIRDLMVVVLMHGTCWLVVVHGGPCRDTASLVPPVVSASDPVVSADYPLPDFSINFDIFP